MVQVPESLPLYKIRDAVDTACQKHAWNILLSLTDMEFSTVVEDVTEAVADLLSQPTPTAEPKAGTCPKCRHAAHADWCPNMASDNDCACTYDSNEAEPPRIEDMSPGTTFTAAASEDVWRWVVRADGLIVSGLGVGPMSALDLSTVRDVTPPSAERDR